MRRSRLGLVLLIVSTACGSGMRQATAAGQRMQPATETRIIQSFSRGLSAVHAPGAGMQLNLGPDPYSKDALVLQVKYPAPNGNPAARDVWCEAETRDWTQAQAISFRVRPDHALRLSVSLQDRNGVAYTTWLDLKPGEWQTVRVAFADIRPNPYFQPPNARRGAPLDVSDVTSIAFAPQDREAGSFEISRLVLGQ